jgi:hypothetical protein
MKTQKFVVTANLHMVIDLPKTEDRERVLDRYYPTSNSFQRNLQVLV